MAHETIPELIRLHDALLALSDPDGQWRNVNVKFRADKDGIQIARLTVDVMSMAGTYTEFDMPIDRYYGANATSGIPLAFVP